ncbi:MAG: M48 family metallopeptidase [Gammaproteobacteria bacterium]
MSYENHEPPEGINYSKEEPLKELLILLAGASAVVVAVAFALALAAGWLAARIPFEAEQDLAARFEAGLVEDEPSTPEKDAVRQRLQVMADRVAQLQALPTGMTPIVHVRDDGLVNAFATIGGHVIITRGILEKMPHENALVMLLAHEIAHVKHRDPVVALGRGVAVMTALAVMAGVSDSNALASQLQKAGLMTTLRFNRGQEQDADEEALRTLMAWYGHTEGASDLFSLLADAQGGRAPPELLSTHPNTEKRIERMREARVPGDLTPLPPEIVRWISNPGVPRHAAAP